jgi:glycosyltransferase involved in cell wall biosynthesis
MNKEILLSFIVPVYNSEKSLSRCLDSILNQTITDFEIIIVNDGSKDNSQSIIDKYVQEYPDFIKAYLKENGGPGDTRNFGIKNSNGKYIAFVDSDDFLEPDYCTIIKAILDEHNPDMIVINYNRIYSKNQNMFEKVYKFNDWSIFDTPIDISSTPEVICKIEVAAWLRIVKREMFKNEDLLFIKHIKGPEDLEASLKWYINVNKIIVTNKKLYNYYITSNTLNFNSSNIEQFIEVIESVCNYYKKHDKFVDLYDELEYMFTKHMLISNMLRLKEAKHNKKYEVFMLLRSTLIQYFPAFYKNRFLKSEPIYVRTAVSFSYYFPHVFYLILRNVKF